MIRVRILGKGLIPRGGGLAPKKEPIYVDFDYLTVLVYSRNLRVQYLDPETGKFENIALNNFKKIYDKISPKVDQQLYEAGIAKKKAEEEAESKRKAEEEAEAKKKAEEELLKQQQFQKRDKYFNKKKFEQRNRNHQETQEVVTEEKSEQ